MDWLLFRQHGRFGCNARDWSLNRKFQCISAGDGAGWKNAIKKLKKGDKIFALVKGKSYVNYGIVEKGAVIVKSYKNNGKPIPDEVPDNHPWRAKKDPLKDERLVKVNWLKTFDEKDAKRFKGAFANQNVICKLRDQNTFDFLGKTFEVEAPE